MFVAYIKCYIIKNLIPTVSLAFCFNTFTFNLANIKVFFNTTSSTYAYIQSILAISIPLLSLQSLTFLMPHATCHIPLHQFPGCGQQVTTNSIYPPPPLHTPLSQAPLSS